MRPSPFPQRCQHGLTLVELLVSLFILAILAVLSWRTVAAMTDTQAHLTDDGRRFERLVDAVDLLERDLGYVTETAGEPVFRGDGGQGARPGELRFLRTGSGFRDGAAAGPQRIAYRLNEGRLEKLVYPAEWLLAGEPEVRVLLPDGVAGLQFGFRDRAGGWHGSWPVETATGLPRAVEARLLVAGGGEVRRVFALP